MVLIIRVGLNVCFHYSIALDFGEYVLFLEAGSLRVQRERERERERERTGNRLA